MDYHYEQKEATFEGVTLQFKKDPRFGQWRIHQPSGNLSPALTGSFTSFGAAYQAAEQWYSSAKARDVIRQQTYRKRKNEKHQGMEPKETVPGSPE
jgi:hypothetical protein